MMGSRFAGSRVAGLEHPEFGRWKRVRFEPRSIDRGRMRVDEVPRYRTAAFGSMPSMIFENVEERGPDFGRATQYVLVVAIAEHLAALPRDRFIDRACDADRQSLHPTAQL